MKFVDEVTITLNSGHGGAGAISFRREPMRPRGGPDGGDGGRGGHIYFRVTPQMNTLIDFRYKRKFSAPDGQPGSGRNMTGHDGTDLYLRVPMGTVVRDSESNEILMDLEAAEDVLFLKGGRGGKGNWFFRNSVNQAPEIAQPGEDGEARVVKLELKLIADVGVIGYPNAGKSTLISVLSSARPKIADYPFTTLAPNLGVVQVNDEQTFVMADIPGLVPGAHKGVGLGIQFLRHIERTGLFIHLVDASGAGGRDPFQDYLDIENELNQYDIVKSADPDYRPLANRDRLVVLNKADSVRPEDMEELQGRFRRAGIETMVISAAAQKGLKELKTEIGKRVLQ